MPDVAELPLHKRWEMLPLRTKLPFRWEVYMRQSSGSWPEADCRREAPRLPMRSIAILRHNAQLYGVYTRDVSRKGVGFFAPLNLFPGETVSLEFTGGRVIPLSIMRCNRMSDDCFACGAVYDAMGSAE